MRRELVATIGDSERTVVVEPSDDGRWQVTIDGTTHLIDAQEVRPGTWSVLIAGRAHLVDLDARKGGTAAFAGATETKITVEDARRKRLAEAVGARGGASAKGETISAPIAGKVVKILVAVGDEVEPGQSVAVLEAMKMENEIEAERGGTVASLHAAAGQSVDTGDKLVTLS